MTDLRHVLAVNMKERRKMRGISQSALAEQLNTATNYISKIESEKQFPSIPMLERIAAALGIDTLELFSAQRTKADTLNFARQTLLNDMTSRINDTFTLLEHNL